MKRPSWTHAQFVLAAAIVGLVAGLGTQLVLARL
jgi:hypothetical protein